MCHLHAAFWQWAQIENEVSFISKTVMIICKFDTTIWHVDVIFCTWPFDLFTWFWERILSVSFNCQSTYLSYMLTYWSVKSTDPGITWQVDIIIWQINIKSIWHVNIHVLLKQEMAEKRFHTCKKWNITIHIHVLATVELNSKFSSGITYLQGRSG